MAAQAAADGDADGAADFEGAVLNMKARVQAAQEHRLKAEAAEAAEAAIEKDKRTVEECALTSESQQQR